MGRIHFMASMILLGGCLFLIQMGLYDEDTPSDKPLPFPLLRSVARTTMGVRTIDPDPTVPFDADLCYQSVDLGIIDAIRESTRSFCDQEVGEGDLMDTTTVTILNPTLDGQTTFSAITFRDLVLDLTSATIAHDIQSLADDGGGHDPRFRFSTTRIRCKCSSFADFANSQPAPLHVWHPAMAEASRWHPSSVCAAFGNRDLTMTSVVTKTLLIARRDDHNPFFQISSAMNAWILLRALQWDPADTRVVHLDGGRPSPVDALHEALLAPQHGLWTGRAITTRPLHFQGEVVLVPFESTGPLMRNLNTHEPCGTTSELFLEFRAEALAAMNVPDVPVPSDAQPATIITVISRRDYGGRRVQRRWLNEGEVLGRMREHYESQRGRMVEIQSIDFVDLPLREQMRIVLRSDVIIGMHGAGLVNVLWARPRTLVVEIFPRHRERWGYRNLCLHVGCDWHEYRGGLDTGAGDNASDKWLDPEAWLVFFDPLLRQTWGEDMRWVG